METKIDSRRYRKLRRFVVRVFLHAFWWDIVLRQPGLRRLRQPPLPRWQEIARRYRLLAIDLGGVLIKLGQFLSTRVDVLPHEITQALSGLQDEVPAAAVEKIKAAVETDLEKPISDLFVKFEKEPVGSASLAQVHSAVLADGERIVVKVLRPGIQVLVETDLAAIALAARWLKLWRPVRRRVDLDRMVEEFSRTTRAELDLEAEGRNAERIAADFSDDPQLYFPRIHWRFSGSSTLTMEDVSFIKIADQEGLSRAGIDRAAVARKLYQTYMRQIFVTNYIHADPHPGNIFVRPLTGDEEEATEGGRPFQLVFVDFGMMAEVPERLRSALREYAIGLGLRDAHRVVHSYVAAGVLLPGADLKRLEEVHEEMFTRFWGVRLGEMRDFALKQAGYFMRQYWDLILDVPFQAPVELLFVSRAVGLLAGLATSLDPEFDPWRETIPFAQELAQEELREEAGGWVDQVVQHGQLILRLPMQTERVLTQAQRGKLTVQASLAPDAERAINRLDKTLRRLVWVILSAATLIAGLLLYLGLPERPWGWVLIAVSGFMLVSAFLPGFGSRR
jgi:predicted unusual protein kinase regulating ubiquinone biosynthesis (AarF/ABC1/UbiB family)